MSSSTQQLSSTGRFRSRSGFGRTLSSELISTQDESTILDWLDVIIETKTCQPGDVIIHRGEKNRDLYFLTEGVVEISIEDKDGNKILDDMKAPNIFGDLGFLFGYRQTSTATAKTELNLFVVKYDQLREKIRRFPVWLPLLMSSAVSGFKELHDEINKLEIRISVIKRAGSTQGER